MKWTTDKPTREGYYFVKDHSLEVRYLNVGDESDEIHWNDGDSPNDDQPDTKYAGPIPKPSDDFDTYDLIKADAARNGLSGIGVWTCYKLGFASYLEVIRLGGFFPHH